MKSNLISSAAVACALFTLLSSVAYAGDSDASKTNGADLSKNITAAKPEEPTPLDLISLDTDYTAESNLRQALPLAKQDASHLDFNYGHRIHITGQWYLRLGVEYERYDFSGTPYPTPDHLQNASATIACEYVVQGFAGAAIELHPGFYFENDVTSRNFDVPFDVYSAFKIKDDKLFGMVGFYEGQFIKPVVIPIIGVIWLTSDKSRLEAIFPRPSYVYNPNDDWEFRLTGEIGGNGYRMDNEGRTPQDYRGSVLLYDYMRAGAQATYSHWKPFDVTVGAGYNFVREFDFFRDGPGQVYKAAGAPYIKVNIETKF